MEPNKFAFYSLIGFIIAIITTGLIAIVNDLSSDFIAWFEANSTPLFGKIALALFCIGCGCLEGALLCHFVKKIISDN